MLTNWGCSVEVARDGDEAWQILRADDGPRLAILDWMMPGMEGLEVCRLARAAFGGDVYILILTSKTQREDLAAAMEAGADDYVTKPFKSQELAARLRIGCRILDLKHRLAVARECSCEHATHCLYGQNIAAEAPVLEPALKTVHRSPRRPYQSQPQPRITDPAGSIVLFGLGPAARRRRNGRHPIGTCNQRGYCRAGKC